MNGGLYMANLVHCSGFQQGCIDLTIESQELEVVGVSGSCGSADLFELISDTCGLFVCGLGYSWTDGCSREIPGNTLNSLQDVSLAP